MSSRKAYLEQATRTYAEQLKSQKGNVGLRAYLTERGIGEYEIARKYRLGYVETPLQGDEHFRGRLAIPYLTRSGPASIKFRRLGHHGAKYLYHPGQKVRLYNSEVANEADGVIGLCEGEIDAIVATERLGVPTMGVPGVEVWERMARVWSPIFKDFTRVWVFVDGDDAGKRLANDVAESLGWRARVVQCDSGEDLGSTVASGNGDALRKRIAE